MIDITHTQVKDLAKVGEDIGLAEGAQMIADFRFANPDATKGYYIGKDILNQILAQPGCVGINFRKGYSSNNEEHVVYSGVGQDGKDILTLLAIEQDGKLIRKDAIVADRGQQVDIGSDTIEEIIRKILGL